MLGAMTADLIGQARGFLTSSKALGGVAVVGDLAIDRFVFGSVDRISPEAPVPVLLVDRTQDRPGCAANVAVNLTAWRPTFSFPVHVVGVVGTDVGGDALETSLREQGVDLHLIRDGSRPTTLKTRFVAGSQHQLLRVDAETSQRIGATVADQIYARVEKLLPQIKCLVVQDYAKGLFSESLLSRILTAARKAGVMTLVDPHPRTPGAHYKGASLITPNVAEAEILLGRSLHKGIDNKEIAQAGTELKNKFQLDMAIITRSGHGMTLVDREGKDHHFPALARAVYDVTGAGDTVAAVMAASFAAGLSPSMACILSTAAASVVVGKVGTATASVSEILDELREFKSLNT